MLSCRFCSRLTESLLFNLFLVFKCICGDRGNFISNMIYGNTARYFYRTFGSLFRLQKSYCKSFSICTGYFILIFVRSGELSSFFRYSVFDGFCIGSEVPGFVPGSDGFVVSPVFPLSPVSRSSLLLSEDFCDWLYQPVICFVFSGKRQFR